MNDDKDISSASPDWVYWMGCAANYDARVAAIARATAKVLGAAGLRLRFLGAEEACSGDAARRLGEEGLFQQLALQNIETLQRHGAQRIVTHCAHCFHVLKNEYPRFGGEFEVMHHSELIASLLERGRIKLRQDASVPATLHDSCYVGRYNRIFDAPRAVLRAVYGDALVEMPRHGERSFCCGAGGANYWYDVAKKESAGTLRAKEAVETGARVVVAECPFCVKMLALGAQTAAVDSSLQIKDIAEVVAEALDLDRGSRTADDAAKPCPPNEGEPI
jgi:Fe-S oxidoreductase